MCRQSANTFSIAGPISRADLLRILALAGEEELRTAAELAGFEAPSPPEKLVFKLPDVKLPEDFSDSPEPQTYPEPETAAQPPIYFYRLIDRKPSNLLPPPQTQTEGRQWPDWYYRIPALDLAGVKAPDVKPPEKLPLVPWGKLWPVLQQLLSELKRSRQADIPRLTKTLAHAEIPPRIPRKSKQSWIAEVQLLVDRPERTVLFNEDYNTLLDQLQKLRGSTGLLIRQIMEKPGGRVRIRRHKTYHYQPWLMPEPASAIVILSDLGLLDRSGQAGKEWLHFGKRLRSAGFMPIVLLPLPQRYLDQELIGLFNCLCWTRYSDMQPIHWMPARQEHAETALEQDIAGRAVDVLAWLSPAVCVEPPLLRAICQQLHVDSQDSGIEAAVWSHDDVQPSNIGFFYKQEAREKYRRRFKQLALRDPVLANRIVAILRRYHAHVFPTQYHEEMLVIAELMGEQLASDYAGQIDAAIRHFRQLLKALNEKPQGGEGLAAFAWHYCRRQHQAMYDYSQDQRFAHLAALQGVLLREYIENLDQLVGKKTLTPQQMQAIMQFAERQQPANRYVLCQRGKELRLCPEQEFTASEDGFSTGFRLTSFQWQPDIVLYHQPMAEGENRLTTLRLQQGFADIPLLDSERQTLHLCGQQLIIERFQQPDWAVAVNCLHDVLAVTTHSAEGFHDWYWHNPEIGGGWKPGSPDRDPEHADPSVAFPGFWYFLSSLSHENVPLDWPYATFRDQYGLYADVTIAGVVQRFRWIQPGSFWMGSPQEEKGRYHREIQHRVILTQGYWLADTVCTQALWQAVMGSNPSQFKGDNRPVETISWNDIQEFLKRLNELQPALKLRLPTEAEWEYACRAGSTGAFNFAGELNLEKVNYSGVWEWSSLDTWGKGASQHAVDVKTHSANAWGLYEMHGNVWEWCQDWYEDYPSEEVIDPQGPESGDERVMRGGSWLGGGMHCRSARRSFNSPFTSFDGYGFRLARCYRSV